MDFDGARDSTNVSMVFTDIVLARFVIDQLSLELPRWLKYTRSAACSARLFTQLRRNSRSFAFSYTHGRVLTKGPFSGMLPKITYPRRTPGKLPNEIPCESIVLIVEIAAAP